jgi:superfamily II DNA or RNA helicase
MLITRTEAGLARLDFQYNALLVDRVKKIPGRRFNEHPLGNYWTAPVNNLRSAVLSGILTPGYLWPNLLSIVPNDLFKGLAVEIKADRLRVRGSNNIRILLRSLYDLCSYEYEIEKESCIGSLVRVFKNNNAYIVSFPKGLHSRITSFLRYFQFSAYKEYSNTRQIEPTLKLSLNGFTPRPYQQKACSKIVEGKIPNRATLVMATGAGKTILSAAIISRLQVPTIFYTYSLDLLEQTAQVYEKALGVKIGKVGGRYFSIEDITVATVQTVYNCLNKTDKRAVKLLDYLNTVEAQFVDEGHMLGADTIYAVSAFADPYYSYALTATPFREDGKEIFIEAATGPIIELISEEELVRGGYILPVRVEIYPIKHYPTKVKKYQTLYEREIVDHWERTRSIVKAAKKYADKQVIVLVKDIFHGNKLSELLRAPFIHGSTSTEERTQALQKFKEKKINLLIASSILKQGVDIPEAEVLILAHGGASLVELMQKIGRVRRPSQDKTVGIIVDFYDEIQPLQDNDVLLAQAKKRIVFYKTKGFEIVFQGKEVVHY